MTTIVIGAGPAGLATANLLADSGEEVTVLEGRQHIGGRARTDERAGHLLNQGPHALYRKGPAMEVLAALGIHPRGWTPPLKGALALFEDHTELLPVSAPSILRSGALRGAGRVEVARLLATIRRVEHSALAHVSTREWIDAVVGSPEARSLVEALVRLSTYCANAEELSAQVAVTQLQLAAGGVVYLDGGWGAMVAALHDRARARGAAVRTSSTVRHIQRTARGWSVCTDDAELVADQVVLAGAGPSAAARLTGSPVLAGVAETATPVTAACLDLGLGALPRATPSFALGIDRPWYFSVHCPHADLGAGATLHAMRYGGPAAEDRVDLEAMIDRLQPGWREETEAVRFLPRAVVCHVLPTAAAGGLHGRPPVTVEGLDGVFVVGDWVGGVGHLLDAALASARETASLVLARSVAA